MTKQEQFRKLMEAGVSSFKFGDVKNRQGCVDTAWQQLNSYFIGNVRVAATAELLFKILNQLVRGEKISFGSYTDKQLWDMLALLKEESYDGYMLKSGVIWTGQPKMEKLEQLLSQAKQANMSASDKLVASLLDGSIVDCLRKDFPGMQLCAKEEYVKTISMFAVWMPNTGVYVFGTYKDYRLEIIDSGYLNNLSMFNSTLWHLPLNSRLGLGFRVVNGKTSKIVMTNTYSDIKRLLGK